MKVEKVNCLLCGEAESFSLFREDPFQMVQCSSCRFIYLNPRPTEESLHRFYQDYLPEDEEMVKAWQEMMRPVFKKAGDLIQRYKRNGLLLDVGAGFGFFLSEMKSRGWEVLGIDLSQKAMAYAREVLGVPVHPGPLEKAGFPENHFDAVSGFYLIEHLPHPMAFLRECYRILKPGGLLLLRYPHTTPIKNLLRLFGIENRLYDLPAHLSDFSPGTIRRGLIGAGFKEYQNCIGGYTLPSGVWKRVASSLFGNVAEALFFLSGKTFLFPGVSKTVLAFK